MDIRELDDRVSVSGQIGPEDVAEIAAAGYKAIICNRPDDEHGPDQPSFASVAAAAQAAGIKAFHIPFNGATGPLPGQAEEVAAVLAETEGPVFMYCRSGARSTGIYGQALAL